MILNNSSDFNQAYLLEHHQQTRNYLFAIIGYLHLLKNNSCLSTDIYDEQAEYIKTIEEYCFQLLEHEKKLISILFLDCYRQSFSTTELN